MKRKALLIDTNLCVGCEACVWACKEGHGLSDDSPGKRNDKTYTTVKEYNDVYVRELCLNCEDPTCVAVCPVGAFTKQETGAVLWDEKKCLGCRYCMQACPFHIPTYEWGSLNPEVVKCDFCHDLTSKGESTRCSSSCPTGATLFGDRDAILAEARRRLKLKEGDYHDFPVHTLESGDTMEHEVLGYYPHIFGETEVGGTDVFFISDRDIRELGYFKNLPDYALRHKMEPAMGVIPDVIVTAGIFFYGMNWIINRRIENGVEPKTKMFGKKGENK